MDQQLEYFTFGKSDARCFEKKKCTLSINVVRRTVVIQPVDGGISPISFSFDRSFFQLKNLLYIFDLVGGSDLVIVCQKNTVCSKVISVIEYHKAECKHSFNDLFKTRFLPPFCRRFMPLTLEDSIDSKLIDEIIETFGRAQKEMFSDAIWEQRQKDCQQRKDTQVSSTQVSTTAAELQDISTDDFELSDIEILDFTDQSDRDDATLSPGLSDDDSQEAEFSMRLRKRPSSYVDVDLDESTVQKKQPREFEKSMINNGVSNDGVDHSVKPRQGLITVDAEDPDYVIRYENFKLAASKVSKLPNRKLIIFASNGLRYDYYYDSTMNRFRCVNCSNSSAYWFIDINGEEYIKLGVNKMNHQCSGLWV